jgi:hypothetical protein
MDIEKKIEELERKLTGNMIEDMEIRNEIHQLRMKLHNIKPNESYFECVGCSG